MTQDPFATLGFQNRRRPQGLLAPIMWLCGVIATVAPGSV